MKKILAAIMLTTFVCHGAFAFFVPLCVDEVWELSAANMILSKGIPLFSSGVLWTSGGPFVYLQALFIGIFGYSEFVFRLPAVFASVCAVWLAYRLGSDLFGHVSGIAAAVAIALDPGFIMWASYGRAYAYLPMLTLLSLWLLRSAALEPRAWKIWAAFACLAVMAWTQLMTALTFPAFVVAYWVWCRKIRIADLLAPVSMVLACSLGLAWLIYNTDPGVVSSTQSAAGILSWNVAGNLLEKVYHFKEYADRYLFFALAIMGTIIAVFRARLHGELRTILNGFTDTVALLAFLVLSLIGFSVTNYPGTHYILLPLSVFFLLGGALLAWTTSHATGDLSREQRSWIMASVVTVFCLLSFPKALKKDYTLQRFYGLGTSGYEYILGQLEPEDGIVDNWGGAHLFVEPGISIYNNVSFLGNLGTGFYLKSGRYYSRLQNSLAFFSAEEMEALITKHDRLWFCLDGRLVGNVNAEVYQLIKTIFRPVFADGEKVVYLYEAESE